MAFGFDLALIISILFILLFMTVLYKMKCTNNYLYVCRIFIIIIITLLLILVYFVSDCYLFLNEQKKNYEQYRKLILWLKNIFINTYRYVVYGAGGG